MEWVIAIVSCVYIFYTYKFYFELERSVVFTNRQKNLHAILIWLIPFLWIIVLKGMIEPVKGSHHHKKKRELDSNDESVNMPVYDDTNTIHHSHYDHGSHHGGHDSGGHDGGH